MYAILHNSTGRQRLDCLYSDYFEIRVEPEQSACSAKKRCCLAMISFSKKKKKCFPAFSGGLCAQRDGRRPPEGRGAHGAGDSPRQRAPESSRKEQQPGADSLQHPSAVSGHHPRQQEEQTTDRYFRPSFLLSLLTCECTV